MGSQATIVTLFVEGMLSFFSPCVIPLIPLYIGYLTADAKTTDENGNIVYKRSKVLFTSLFFVLGISMIFFIAGLSISTFKEFFLEYQLVFSMVGGMLLIVFGCIHLKILRFPLLEGEYRLPIKMDLSKMNFLKAFLLGFFFSFAWTPCIGPMLSSAFILAANATSVWIGNLYIFAYALGFILMFLLLGIFTEEILNLLKKNQNIMRYTVIIGGVLILVMGGWMVVNTSSEIVSLKKQSAVVAPTPAPDNGDNVQTVGNEMETYNFTLKDQHGESHTLTDYKGDTVFVTFFATWCSYCKQELPILQELQKEDETLKILVVTRPNYGQETDQAGIEKFIAENGYEDMTFLFDEDGAISSLYGVTGYPTSFVYKPDGTLLGYLPGAAPKETLIDIIQQTKN